MFKFIKNLFTKMKQFTLDDLNLFERLKLKLVSKKDGYWYEVYFMHPLYKKPWPMPSRKISSYSKWSLLNKHRWTFKPKNILTIYHWDRSNLFDRFETVNDLKIYAESLERKYNELHP